MTLKAAKKVFVDLLTTSLTNSELKLYLEFSEILNSLEKRNLSESELISIELELDRLNLEQPSKNTKRYYRKALNQFKNFLKIKFSLTTKRYYTSIGMSLGMCFGVAFGSLIDRVIGVSAGLSIGLLIGLLIGVYMDNQAVSRDKVI